MATTGEMASPSARKENIWYLHRPEDMTHLVVFFGGFFDGTFKPVKAAVDLFVAQKRYGKTTGIMYFSWSDAAFWSDFAREKIIEIVPGSRLQGLALVGHSYGAHSARKVADQINAAVDVLVTVDGVSWESALFWFSKPAAVKRWINVYENWIGDFSDVVACIGGHWGHEGGADVNISVPKATHAQFHTMFMAAEGGMKGLMGLK